MSEHLPGIRDVERDDFIVKLGIKTLLSLDFRGFIGMSFGDAQLDADEHVGLRGLARVVSLADIRRFFHLNGEAATRQYLRDLAVVHVHLSKWLGE